MGPGAWNAQRDGRDEDSNAEVGTRNVEFFCADGQRAKQANRLNRHRAQGDLCHYVSLSLGIEHREKAQCGLRIAEIRR